MYSCIVSSNLQIYDGRQIRDKEANKANVSTTYQLLEEVPHTLLVAPVLDSGQQRVIEVFVDLMKLWDFEEDGLNLLGGQHRLGSCGRSSQRLHRLDK